jgi:hypothetical protein
MGFLTPKAPKPAPPPTPAAQALTPFNRPTDTNNPLGYSSLITGSPAGLNRKNGLNKVSLIGGG